MAEPGFEKSPRHISTRNLTQNVAAVAASSDGISSHMHATSSATVTASATPVLNGAWMRPWTHVKLWDRAMRAGEVDQALVIASRFIAGSVRSVKAAGAEYLSARHAGLIGEDHIAGEIGEVLLGRLAGRRNDREITL